MDELRSSEFRKRYAKLDRPTRVIVLGRVIGTWFPIETTEDLRIAAKISPSFGKSRPAPKPGR
jgi:hypothetical protein